MDKTRPMQQALVLPMRTGHLSVHMTT